MTAQTKDVESDQWLSTYGLITIDRILGKYQMKLSAEKISAVIRNQSGFYHDILRIPLKNILNGIVIQQSHDYYVYAQKLYIDYLLSPETASPEEAPGASIRDSLEEQRSQLLLSGDEFHDLELRQDTFISQSQVYLIQKTQEWKAVLEKTIQTLQKTLKNSGFPVYKSLIKDAIDHVLIHGGSKKSPGDRRPSDIADGLNEVLNLSLNAEIKEKLLLDLSPLLDFSTGLEETLSDFNAQTQTINELARTFRQQVYETILRAIDLMKLLPVYKIDPLQDQINKEILHFDKTIGETQA